jgi:hypothetical protein
MRIPKQYGSTTPKCLYCENPATTRNKENISVCKFCKDKPKVLKCPTCGRELESRDGKFGAYFYCFYENKNWTRSKILKF